MTKYIIDDESCTVYCTYDRKEIIVFDKKTGCRIPNNSINEFDSLKEKLKKYDENFESYIGYFAKLDVKNILQRIECSIRYKELHNERK